MEELQALRVSDLEGVLEQEMVGVGHRCEVGCVVVVFEVLKEKGVLAHDGSVGQTAKCLLWGSKAAGVEPGQHAGVEVEVVTVLACEVYVAYYLVPEGLVSLHVAAELFTGTAGVVLLHFDQILEPVESDPLQFQSFQFGGDQLDIVMPQKKKR